MSAPRCAWCSNPGEFDAVGAEFHAVERPDYLCGLHWCVMMACEPDETGMSVEQPRRVYGPTVHPDIEWSADDLRAIALVPRTAVPYDFDGPYCVQVACANWTNTAQGMLAQAYRDGYDPRDCRFVMFDSGEPLRLEKGMRL